MEDKKGQDIVLLDVRGLSSVTDYTLIVSGSSPPHLKALFGAIHRSLKDEHVSCYRKAGTPDCGWLVMDYIDVIMHIFLDETRRHYALEELWAEAPRVP
jgi:ribosome-associated protein